MAFDFFGEREYENDVLADWRFVADGKRRLREEELVCCLAWEEARLDKETNLTLGELLGTRYIYDFESETWKELYYMAEKDEKWEIIVDKENKRIKFIDGSTWKIIYKDFF